jgi:hypothetical protein
MRCGKGMRSIRSSTRSAAPRQRPTAPAWTAGCKPAGSRVSLAVELQRDWARQDTVAAIIEIVLTDRLLKEQ